MGVRVCQLFLFYRSPRDVKRQSGDRGEGTVPVEAAKAVCTLSTSN